VRLVIRNWRLEMNLSLRVLQFWEIEMEKSGDFFLIKR